jgi:transcriptional antiterminator NusG
MQFFTLRVASNKEDQVREKLARKVKIEALEETVGRIPDKVWFTIKETEGVGDFIGSNGKPSPMKPDEEARLVDAAEHKEEAASLRTEYKKGDKIKVTDGAFINFEGEVDEIMQDKGMVRIVTTIFGRPTPLELEYWQIEKM